MKATFSQAGSFTTIQDGGRFGMAHLGFPPSGFMDAVSARLANRLVANEPDEALLEITWTGVEFSVDVACAVALTGAQFACTLNGKPIDTYGVVSLQAGDCLRMGQLLSGVRAYLSFAGGLSLPKVGRSVSTLTLAGLGGLHGRPLQAGDELPLKQPQQVLNEQYLPGIDGRNKTSMWSGLCLVLNLPCLNQASSNRRCLNLIKSVRTATDKASACSHHPFRALKDSIWSVRVYCLVLYRSLQTGKPFWSCTMDKPPVATRGCWW